LRCQRFDLRRLSTEQILSQLKKSASRKGYLDADAPLMIAREAEGSLRDSQSLLDQAIAYSAGKLSAESAEKMLASPPPPFMN
jgi:DNA polymerase-3 subunit gamma/tau